MVQSQRPNACDSGVPAETYSPRISDAKNTSLPLDPSSGSNHLGAEPGSIYTFLNQFIFLSGVLLGVIRFLDLLPGSKPSFTKNSNMIEFDDHICTHPAFSDSLKIIY